MRNQSPAKLLDSILSDNDHHLASYTGRHFDVDISRVFGDKNAEHSHADGQGSAEARVRRGFEVLQILRFCLTNGSRTGRASYCEDT